MTGQCLTASRKPKSTGKAGAVQLEDCEANGGENDDSGINATQQWTVSKRSLPLPPHFDATSNQADTSVAYSIESVAQPGM